MAGRISQEIRTKVIREHLTGNSRDEIASETNIAEGSVSHIISEWKKGLQDPQYQDVRELAVQAKRLGMSLTDCAASFRLLNIFKKMKIDENKIESFIINIQDSCINAKEGQEEVSKEEIVKILMELLEISKSQSIPLQDVKSFVTEKIEEKQQVIEDIEAFREQKQNAEIEATKAIQRKGITIEAINEHLSLGQELAKFSLSTREIPKACTTLKHVHQLGYDPNKVVAKFSSITSLENEEKTLRGKNFVT
jgi:orotate phosphoribosyltransferase-like protein